MSPDQVLSSSPRMLPLFARAGAALIPGSSRLPVIGGPRGQELPASTLVLEEVEVDRERLASYNHVCEFPLRDQLPVTYPHILAFPLHLRLMTDPAFPFAALGLVHVENSITQHRPVLAAEKFSVRVWAADLRPHPRGTQFDLRTEARVGEEPVWDETTTILKRGGGGGEGRSHSSSGSRDNDSHSHEARGPGPVADRPPDRGPSATWRLPGDLGRRYASVSGDLNPIHLHPLSARLLGFPRSIIHGMWTKARCLAALDPELPDRFTVTVSFRKPIFLPGSVEFREWPQAQGIAFSVRGAGRGTPHLDGEVRPS